MLEEVYVPALHAIHCDDDVNPDVTEYDPDGQVMQDEAPKLLLVEAYVPALQLTHDAAVLVVYVPAPHTVQVEAPCGDQLPELHVRQPVAEAFEY